ncbi:MAG: hypothetical protein ACR2PR_09380 [Pseudohongiellaceae bacterium]
MMADKHRKHPALIISEAAVAHKAHAAGFCAGGEAILHAATAAAKKAEEESDRLTQTEDTIYENTMLAVRDATRDIAYCDVPKNAFYEAIGQVQSYENGYKNGAGGTRDIICDTAIKGIK